VLYTIVKPYRITCSADQEIRHVIRNQIIYLVGFEAFTAVTTKNAVFWDVAPYRSCVNRRFGGTYPEDGGDTFLRDIGSHKIYTAPHPRRRHSALITLIDLKGL
jgi:hypothetical protein